MSTDQNTAPIVPADKMTMRATLPADWNKATLVGRVMLPGVGPAVVYLHPSGNLLDITASYATTTDLFEQNDPAAAVRLAAYSGRSIGRIDDVIANSSLRDPSKPYLLSPADFQEIEAAGVTFVKSMVERMVENAVMLEQAKFIADIKERLAKQETVEETLRLAAEQGKMPPGMLDKIRARVRSEVQDIIGDIEFSKVVPGSPAALRVLAEMKARGVSTIYPEVGLGEEGEIFGKAASGTSVGHGAQAGYSPGEEPWVNPEPEVVIAANSKGKFKAVAHGNDVNDRKKEGSSPLKLHRAKVKNGSTAIGPFWRLFDHEFTMENVKKLSVGLEVWRADGTLAFKDESHMDQISRSPEAIVAAACDSEREHEQGVVVFCGTMIIPEKDNLGRDFTHYEGDVVRIGSPELGYVTNVMRPADKVQGLEKGALALARNLAKRGLLVDGQELAPARTFAGRH